MPAGSVPCRVWQLQDHILGIEQIVGGCVALPALPPDMRDLRLWGVEGAGAEKKAQALRGMMPAHCRRRSGRNSRHCHRSGVFERYAKSFSAYLVEIISEEHTAADDQGATAGVATGAEYSVAYRSRGLAVGSA